MVGCVWWVVGFGCFGCCGCCGGGGVCGVCVVRGRWWWLGSGGWERGEGGRKGSAGETGETGETGAKSVRRCGEVSHAYVETGVTLGIRGQCAAAVRAGKLLNLLYNSVHFLAKLSFTCSNFSLKSHLQLSSFLPQLWHSRVAHMVQLGCNAVQIQALRGQLALQDLLHGTW